GKYVVYARDQSVIKSEVYELGGLVSTISSASFPDSHIKRRQCTPNASVIDDKIINKYDNLKAEYQRVRKKEETKDNKRSQKGFVSGLQKMGRVVFGVDAYQSRNSAKSIREA